MAKGIALARIGAYPIIPPGAAGFYSRWCAFEGIDCYAPEMMTDEQRAQYEEAAGEPAPPRNPYRFNPRHPLRLGHQATKDVDPWLAYPGATVTEQCLAWLRAEFGPRRA